MEIRGQGGVKSIETLVVGLLFQTEVIRLSSDIPTKTP